MKSANRKHFYRSSNLVEVLDSLDALNVKPDHHRFGERFGDLIFLSDSFGLADAHAKIARSTATPIQVNAEHTIEQIIRLRQVLKKRIGKAFTVEAQAYMRAPGINDGLASDELTDYSVWRKFYVSAQREMALSVSKCRSLAQSLLMQTSDSLAQLALLDQSMTKVLDAPNSRALAKVPQRLQSHFEATLDVLNAEHSDRADYFKLEDNLSYMHSVFYRVLIAESEFRFEPVMGLLKAYEKEEEVLV